MPTFPGTFPSGIDAEGRYSTQLARLLPPGSVWDREASSELTRVLTACADEFERLRERGRNLIDETDPRTAGETISDWEQMLSLPDELVPVLPTTLEGRRTAVTTKYISRGGQDLAFFTALCGASGWPLVSITNGFPLILRAGFRANDRAYDAAYGYSMTITVSAPTAYALPAADFERLVRHATHAHIQVLFVYT